MPKITQSKPQTKSRPALQAFAKKTQKKERKEGEKRKKQEI